MLLKARRAPVLIVMEAVLSLGHCCTGPLLLLRLGAKPDNEETDKRNDLVDTDARPDRSRADTLCLVLREGVEALS